VIKIQENLYNIPDEDYLQFVRDLRVRFGYSYTATGSGVGQFDKQEDSRDQDIRFGVTILVGKKDIFKKEVGLTFAVAGYKITNPVVEDKMEDFFRRICRIFQKEQGSSYRLGVDKVSAGEYSFLTLDIIPRDKKAFDNTIKVAERLFIEFKRTDFKPIRKNSRGL